MIFTKRFHTPGQERAAISVTEAKRRLEDENALLVDVRETHEWQEGHVAGAVHLPLGSLPAAASGLPQEGELIVICHTGKRSALAQEKLTQAGFTHVTNVAGGMTAWGAQGFPAVTDEEHAQ